ncbi:MAG: N-acetylmuramoyl-L-alanine amidase [Micavibrio sp.]|nr:N-acetylmuramoyl-L-alanine amidase [Micavibrio sp.]
MKIIDKPSPNYNDRGDVKPSILLMHYTGMKTAQEALDRLTDEASEVSAHYTVDVDGTIYKHVDEDKRAWHAGAGAWRNLTNINSHSIGIEIVNKGHEFGYEAFPDVQIKAIKGLALEIMERHDILPENVLAHSDVAPDRKEDPGELFPWKELATHGIGVWPEVSVEDTVKATGIDVFQALKDFGYHADDQQKALFAFQRHFEPEVFVGGHAGEVTSRTKSRLYTLLARYS